MKLFAVYIGGTMKGANLELHDLRFVTGEAIEETHEELRRQWWGVPSSLHIDCWCELTRADGYAVTLRREAQQDGLKLFLVHLGGYDPAQFTEMHQNLFIVAPDAAKAKTKALATVRHWDAPHKDELYDIDQLVSVSDQLSGEWHVHLEKMDDASPAPFICSYKPIGKRG